MEELFGGSIEGALFFFGSVPDEGSFGEVNGVEQELARVGFAPSGLFDDLADDFGLFTHLRTWKLSAGGGKPGKWEGVAGSGTR